MIINLIFLIETPKMTNKDKFALSSDLISELLTGMRLRGVQYRRIQTGPSFGLGFEDKPGHAYFHFLAVGTAFLRTDDGELHELSAGSAVFIPQGGGISFYRMRRFHFRASTHSMLRPLAKPSAG